MSATTTHAVIPEVARRLLAAPYFATVATTQPDGSAQQSVIWVKIDGDDVLFSTILGRRKTLNMQRDPRLSLIVFDPENPYAYVEVRGTVSITEEGGDDLIQELSQAYTGGRYSGDDGTGNVRVVCRVTPAKVITRAL